MLTDASIKGKIKSMAKKGGVRPQELLQMYLFEHFLLRLEKSSYVDKFVLKGGLLVSSMIGVMQRTTMDMDATVVGLSMDEDIISNAIRAICSIEVDDGMDYLFERIEPIRENDKYANWRVHLRVRYGKIDAPIKVDLTTGDEIVPGAIVYSYPLMFQEGSVRVCSYPLETVLAEKLETVVSRGIANTRGRDFYDIHLLFGVKHAEIARESLKAAIAATAKKRNSTEKLARSVEVLEEVRASDAMRDYVWNPYIKNAPYVGDLGFDEVIDSALRLVEYADVEAVLGGCYGDCSRL